MRPAKDSVFILSSGRMRAYRIVCIILVLLWMGVIFFFSSDNGEESSALSRKVTEYIARFFFRDWFTAADAAALSQRLGKLEYLVRKAAHFTEYLILGGLLALVFSTIRMKYSGRIVLSVLIGILYAMSDEFHQSFVAGRAMQGFDVLIDSGGVIFGAIVFSGISAMIIMDFVLKRRTLRRSSEDIAEEL